MAADSLPPYQQAAPRGARIQVDNILPSYAPIVRSERERVDDHPPPDYFAASPTDCPHWVKRRCRLTARPRHCCTCMDMRPETVDGRYPVYMDGYAELGSVVRWAHYCEACRNAESRLHKCANTKAQPPPGANAYRASGSERARAARQLAAAKSNMEANMEANGDTPDWFTSETTGQRKARERRERMERKERSRALHEAAREAAEKKRDDAWEADQLQRLSRGEPVASVTVRRHFVMARPGKQRTTEKGKEKCKEKSVVGMCWDHRDSAAAKTAEPETLGPVVAAVTAAEVRAARKLWEAAGAASEEDVREQQRWHAIERARAQEAKDEEARRKRAAEQRAQYDRAMAKQHSEYEAYGDSADVHQSVSRTISRESAGRRARAASSSTPTPTPGGSGEGRSGGSSSSWYSRLFRRRGAR